MRQIYRLTGFARRTSWTRVPQVLFYRDDETRSPEAADFDDSCAVDAGRHSRAPVLLGQVRMVRVVAAKLAAGRFNPGACVLFGAAHECVQIERAKAARVSANSLPSIAEVSTYASWRATYGTSLIIRRLPLSKTPRPITL